MYNQVYFLIVLFTYIKLCASNITSKNMEQGYSPCNITSSDKCVNVCCKQGEMMDMRKPEALCIPTKWSSWSIENMTDGGGGELRPRYNNKPVCPPDHILRKPKKIKNHIFSVLEDGSLQIEHPKYVSSILMLPPESFCVGVNRGGASKALICRSIHTDYNKVYTAPLLLSAAFLVATILVYAGFPELRNTVTGISLIAHCACVLIAHFAYLVETVQSPTLESAACSIYAYVELYSLLAGSFWLNVMCIDIALKFRSLDTMVESGPLNRRRVMLYSIYAMGCPLMVVLSAVWVDHADLSEFPAALSKLKTHIGQNSCWFDSDTMAEALYCLIPRGLLLLFNIGLFVNTLLNIKSFSRQSSEQPHKLDQRNRKNFDIRKNKRLALFAKLLTLLGSAWLLELIFWCVEFTQQYSDWVIIFFVLLVRIVASIVLFYCFCCKKMVWRLMTARFPVLAHLRWPCSTCVAKFFPGGSQTSKKTTENNVLNSFSRDEPLSGIDNQASSFT